MAAGAGAPGDRCARCGVLGGRLAKLRGAAVTEDEAARLLTPPACRAARALLGWRIADLVKEAEVSPNSIVQLERGGVVHPSTALRIVSALERAQVELIRGPGTGAVLLSFGSEWENYWSASTLGTPADQASGKIPAHQRAVELARSGDHANVRSIRAALRREGYTTEQARLNGSARSLTQLCQVTRTCKG